MGKLNREPRTIAKVLRYTNTCFCEILRTAVRCWFYIAHFANNIKHLIHIHNFFTSPESFLLISTIERFNRNITIAIEKFCYFLTQDKLLMFAGEYWLTILRKIGEKNF